MPTAITSFQGQYRFLSNFWVEEDGLTVEHRFQAAKTNDILEKSRIMASITPGQAKRWGRLVHLRGDWESIKIQTMEDLVRTKFQDPNLAQALLATGDAELIEGNSWYDTYWGVNKFNGEGYNHLGVILMKIREELGGAGSAITNENKDTK